MTSTERIERLAERLSEQETTIKQLTQALGSLTDAIELMKRGGDEHEDGATEEETVDDRRGKALLEILENFNYNRVVEVCNFMEWRVATRNGVQDVTKEWLKQDTIDKAHRAWEAFDSGEADEEWAVHSGPLKLWWCECDDGIFAELTFVCEEWRVEPV